MAEKDKPGNRPDTSRILQAVFDRLPDAMALVAEDGKILDVNAAYARLFDMEKKDLIGRGFLFFVPMADEIKERVMDEFVKELKEQQFTQFETFIPRGKGPGAWAKINASYTEQDGKMICIATLHDISDRRRIEDGLRKSGEKLRSIFQSVSDGIIVTDMSGTVTEVNQRALRIGGFTSGRDVLGKSFLELVELDREIVRHALLEAMKQGAIRGIELGARRKDGGQFFLEIGASLLRTATDEPQGYIIVMRDITERRVSEERLRASEDRLRDLFDNANDLIQSIDESGRFLFVNRKWVETLGYSEEEALKLQVQDIIHPAYAGAFVDMLRRMAAGEAFEKIETVFLARDRRYVHVEGNAGGRFEGGKLISSRGIFRDVTETRRAEQLYSRVVQNAPFGIYIAQNGHFRLVNPTFEQITGYSQQELSGRDSLSLVLEADQQKVREDAIGMVKGQQVTPHEFRMVRKDGEVRWAIETVVSIDYEGVRATLGNFVDITEQKLADIKLRESQERFSEMARLLPLGVWETDARGHYTYANDHIVQALGYTQEEIKSISLWHTVAREDRGWLIEKTKESVDSGKTMLGVEHRVRRKDGSTYPVIAYSTPIMRDGAVVGSRGLTMDISQLKEMEQELKKRLQELQQANERLKELDRLKDNFLSTVSHELRTPLTSIKSFAEILLNYEEDRATQKEFLGIINEESDRLTRLINDFLDLSKIQSGRVEWHTVEVSIPWAVERAVAATSALFQQTNLHLDIDMEPGLPAVKSDKDRLVQVITNLLGNAQKFTPAGGRVRIAAVVRKGQQGGDDNVTVGVSDTGIGIAPENHDKIFDRFGQIGDTLKDRPKGTGLGLPISREIVEHFGGRLWVESELGKGSTFFFSVPVAAAPVPAPGTEAKPMMPLPPPTGGKKVLVVDDEANIRRFITHQLAARGFEVIEAASGRQAIDLARQHHPDLITLDLVLPDIDGFDVTAVLKADPDTARIPILVVSVTEDRTRAFQLGANDYITKPFSPEALLEKITGLLHGPPRSILIVDDDRPLTRSLEYELRKRGYRVGVVHDGREALRTVEGSVPDLVVLDIKMPEMDGWEVLAALKGNRATAGVHIVVMTGVDDDGGRTRALSGGAEEFLSKSEGSAKLFETIERILQPEARPPQS